MTCLHERRRKVHAKNPYEHWIDTYCRDCKQEVIEHRGVWVTRDVPLYRDLVARYRDELVAPQGSVSLPQMSEP